MYPTKYFVLIAFLIIFGCNQNNETASVAMTNMQTVAPKTKDINSQLSDIKLIKEGEVRFRTSNLKMMRKTIFDAVSNNMGYVASDEEFETSGRRSITLTIRVPAEKFANLLNEATQSVERLESKTMALKDVTEEFIVIEARLKTKKELENRFIELLNEAKNVTQIVEVEKQLNNLRTEIESIEGRLNYLQNRVSFSTLTITFYEDISNKIDFKHELKDGIVNGWNNLVLFLVTLINLWPFILIGLGLIFGIKFFKSRK